MLKTMASSSNVCMNIQFVTRRCARKLLPNWLINIKDIHLKRRPSINSARVNYKCSSCLSNYNIHNVLTRIAPWKPQAADEPRTKFKFLYWNVHNLIEENFLCRLMFEKRNSAALDDWRWIVLPIVSAVGAGNVDESKQRAICDLWKLYSR